MITKITLEDMGQDLLWLRINEAGLVVEAGPFQNEIWKDAYIPLSKVEVGFCCPIHRYGFLKYRAESITEEK